MTEVPFMHSDVSGVYTALFLNKDLLKMALRGRKACGAFEKRAPGRGHCVLFLGKALYSHSASLCRLSTQVYKWVLSNCWGNLKIARE